MQLRLLRFVAGAERGEVETALSNGLLDGFGAREWTILCIRRIRDDFDSGVGWKAECLNELSIFARQSCPNCEKGFLSLGGESEGSFGINRRCETIFGVLYCLLCSSAGCLNFRDERCFLNSEPVDSNCVQLCGHGILPFLPSDIELDRSSFVACCVLNVAACDQRRNVPRRSDAIAICRALRIAGNGNLDIA